jgi:hypothetical protein
MIEHIDNILLNDLFQPFSEKLELWFGKDCVWFGHKCMHMAVISSFIACGIMMLAQPKHLIVLIVKFAIILYEVVFLITMGAVYFTSKCDPGAMNVARSEFFEDRKRGVILGVLLILVDCAMWWAIMRLEIFEHLPDRVLIAMRALMYVAIVFGNASVYLISCTPLSQHEKVRRKNRKK